MGNIQLNLNRQLNHGAFASHTPDDVLCISRCEAQQTQPKGEKCVYCSSQLLVQFQSLSGLQLPFPEMLCNSDFLLPFSPVPAQCPPSVGHVSSFPCSGVAVGHAGSVLLKNSIKIQTWCSSMTEFGREEMW